MEPRVTIVTLGVGQVGASAAFYERLGWKRSSAGNESIAFFQLGTLVLALFGAEELRHDAGLTDEPSSRPGAMSLAHNVESPQAVDAVLGHAASAGAKVLKPAQWVFWGGYSGYFADPDGHLWEVAYNPHFAIDSAGYVHLAG